MNRLETGVVTPSDDWPGVFIRGDNALMGFAPAVSQAIEALKEENPIASAQLQGLHSLLVSCQAGSGHSTQHVQVIEKKD